MSEVCTRLPSLQAGYLGETGRDAYCGPKREVDSGPLLKQSDQQTVCPV